MKKKWRLAAFCCVSARCQHTRISGDPFTCQIVSELRTSQRHLLFKIGGNSTKARNRFAATDFDIDEASSIRSPAFYLHAPTSIRSFAPSAISPFGHNSKQARWNMETCKHRQVCRSHRHSAFCPCSRHFMAVFVKQSFDSIFGKLRSMFIFSQRHQLGNPEYTARFQKLWDFLRSEIWKSKLQYCSSCWKNIYETTSMFLKIYYVWYWFRLCNIQQQMTTFGYSSYLLKSKARWPFGPFVERCVCFARASSQNKNPLTLSGHLSGNCWEIQTVLVTLQQVPPTAT